MARPTKQGLEYFSFDTDFFSDVKIRRISRACGPASTSILICLLCNIYRDKGYYIAWDENLPFVVADTIGTTEGAVEEVIKKAIQVGFFDKELFDKYKILTSNTQSTLLSSAYASSSCCRHSGIRRLRPRHCRIAHAPAILVRHALRGCGWGGIRILALRGWHIPVRRPFRNHGDRDKGRRGKDHIIPLPQRHVHALGMDRDALLPA